MSPFFEASVSPGVRVCLNEFGNDLFSLNGDVLGKAALADLARTLVTLGIWASGALSFLLRCVRVAGGVLLSRLLPAEKIGVVELFAFASEDCRFSQSSC